jgi:hypothetical protein
MEDRGVAANSRATRAGMKVLRRLAKPIPIIGTAVVLATAYAVLKRKGLLRGGLDVALDATPVVGSLKGAVELVTGDLIPDREPSGRAQQHS